MTLATLGGQGKPCSFRRTREAMLLQEEDQGSHAPPVICLVHNFTHTTAKHTQ